jgi:hypothetical protein
VLQLITKMGDQYFEQIINMKLLFKLGRSQQSHYCRRKFFFSAWPWDKAAEHAMEIFRLTPPQESVDVKVKSQDSVDSFIWLQRDSATKCLSHLVRLPTRSSVSKFWNDWDSGFVVWGQNCSSTSESCTMTRRPHTHRAFRQGIFGGKIYCGPGTLRRLNRSGSVCLLPLSYHEESQEGSHFEIAEEIQKVTTAVLNNLREKYFC